MLTVHKLALLSVLLLVQLGSSFGFQPLASKISTSVSSSSVRANKYDESDFPPEDDAYESSIDWDSEWKKVVQNEGKSGGKVSRPGNDYYKSEAEISAIKATNKAAMKAAEVSSSVTNNIPQLSSLTGDWKFWIAILAIVSVGLSVLSAPPAMTNIPPGGSDGSYFI
jgi:hypothetical protein